MKNAVSLVLVPLVCLLTTCANDLKGEKGDTGAAGQDAALSPLIRIRRPAYRYESATKVVVEASTSSPAVFKFGSELVSITSTIKCDLGANPSPCLRDGVHFLAGTAYYLYAIKESESVRLLADILSPRTGPQGFTDWTYIGAFATPAEAASLKPFVSSAGRYQSVGELDTGNDPTTTDRTPWLINMMPLTARFAMFQNTVVGPSPNQSGRISGHNSVHDALATRTQTADVGTFDWGWIPIFVDKTVYVTVNHTDITYHPEFYGWIEDPTEYQ